MSLKMSQLTGSERLSVMRIFEAALRILDTLHEVQQHRGIDDKEILTLFHGLSFCAEETDRWRQEGRDLKEILKDSFTQFVIDEVVRDRAPEGH